MSGPFIYVGTFTLKSDRFDDAKKWLSQHAEFIETNEPRLIAFHVYVDEAEHKAGIVQVHPDTASMEFHMQVIAQHMGDAFEYIDSIVSEQYYGTVSPSLQETLAQYETPGVTAVTLPVHEAGFTRASVR